MAKLIFSLDNAILNEYPLNKERVTIGRRPTNDIHIDNLAVSGEHAAILKKGNDFYIEDQDSTNGTQVNDKLVKSHLLQPGDLIEFGKYELRYVNDGAVRTEPKREAAFEKTILIRPSAMRAMAHTSAESAEAALPTPTAPEPQTATVAAPQEDSAAVTLAVGRIQVLNGSSAGRELVLNKALTTLGKAGVQVAVITKRQHGYFITHVEGRVYPIVNGASTGAQACALSDHDVIELAGVKMEFYLDKL